MGFSPKSTWQMDVILEVAMIELFVAVIFTTGLRYLLLPVAIVPLLGVLSSLYFVSETSDRLWLILLIIFVGAAIQLFEHFFSNYREVFLNARMSINFRDFPEETDANDRRLYTLTFLPTLLLLFLLLYGGVCLIKLSSIQPFMFSIFFSLISLLLISFRSYVTVPTWSPNGRQSFPSEKFYPIHIAARAGDVDALRKILQDQKEQINRKTNKGMAPIHLTIAGGHFDATRLLVESGADLNLLDGSFKRKTPLMKAADMNDRKTVEFLLNKGADPNIISTDTNNILYFSKEHLELVQLFVEHNVDYNHINLLGESMLSIASRMEEDFKPHPSAYPLVKYLLELGMPPDGLPMEKSRPLVEAVVASNQDVVQLLLEKGANPNVKNKFQSTALIEAVSRGSLKMVELLINAGADPNLAGSAISLYSEEVTPLEYAKRLTEDSIFDDDRLTRRKDIVSLLIRSGAK